MKRKLIPVVAAIVLSTFLGGCASGYLRPTTPVAKSDQGLVYFYRAKNILDDGVPLNLMVDYSTVGRLMGASYTFMYVEPGAHTFSAYAGKRFSKTLDIEAGKTYYIQLGIDSNPTRMNLSLVLAPESQAKAELLRENASGLRPFANPNVLVQPAVLPSA